MSANAKSAPLVTFLASVRPSRVLELPEQPSETPEDREKPVERSPHDKDIGQGARAVILTILSKNTEPVPSRTLREQSEMSEDLYIRTLRELEEGGLVKSADGSLTLTSAGVDAAAQERERILSFW